MATITNARLAITPDTTKQTARCVATCSVLFTRYELREMQQGLKFSLNCTLLGQDLGIGNIFNPDDPLYHFATRIFPDATPTSPENVTFDVILGLSLLNEDWGTDEVYAYFVLKNLYTGAKVKAKSNVITRSFAPMSAATGA